MPGPGTVFVYSGQGSQWAGMGQKLLADEPAFAAAVAELEPVFVEQVGFSLQRGAESGEPVVGIDRIQPVLVGMQLALTELRRSYGVEPDAVIGHSMGEATAAVVAGALSPADGLKVIATRSRLMSRLSGQGAMALLELDAAAAEKLIAGFADLTVAVYAAPGQTVIAGLPEQVDAVIAAVHAQGDWRGASRSTWLHTILPLIRSCPSCAPRSRICAGHAEDPADQYGRRNERRGADVRCRLLGDEPAQSGEVQPGRGRCRRQRQHVHRGHPHPLLTHAITQSLSARPTRRYPGGGNVVP